MPLILGANSVSGGYEVDNSLRFNAGSDDSLTRTFGSSGNRKTWTFSTWIKRSNLINANMNILGTDYAGNGEAYFVFRPGETMLYGQYESGGGSNNYSFETTQVFRDVSAWYNILFVWDTTQSTSSNRMKLYINGTQVTSFSTANYPHQNLDGVWNSNRLHYIGDAFYGTNLSGYLSETYFIDGQALDPTYFGETDQDTNIWIPKAYTGSFGTNGFYLEFQNSGALGTDSSGNGNNFTVNNLTSIDQTTDTPTNNFATANPLVPSDSITYSNGNLTLTGSNSTNYSISNTPTFGVSKGKWYCEIKYTTANANTNSCIGVVNYDNYEYNQNVTGGTRGYVALRFDGNLFINAVETVSYFSAPSAGDILMIAMDMDNGKVYFGNNGTWFNSGNPATSTNPASTILTSGTWTPVVRYLASVFEWNFGSPSFTISSGNADGAGFGNFEYAVPSGYFALCTKNLAEYA